MAKLIAISGATASGKSTFARRLCDLLPDAGVVLIHQDRYFRDFAEYNEAEREREVTSNHPRAVLWDALVTHLAHLKSGGSVLVPVDGTRARRRGEEQATLGPAETIVVEGHLLFTEPRILDMADLSVFVDANVHERVVRRLLRDTDSGKTTLEGATRWYRRDVIPNVSRYSEPGRNVADVIVPFDDDNTVAARAVADWVSAA
jgi:uridine kinase